jgi:ABC-type antimicrobial peptide transport system permease subunit
MLVALYIGLWVWNELSFNAYFNNYDRVVQVMQNETTNGVIDTGPHVPMPLANALKDTYGSYFSHIALSSWTNEHILSYGEKKITRTGNYVQAAFPRIFPLKMIKGTLDGLSDPASVMLSESTARALFGNDEPLDHSLLIDGGLEVKVTGVYEDLPSNTSFNNLQFISSWKLYLSSWKWLSEQQNNWAYNAFQMFAQLSPNSSPKQVSEKIKEIKARNADKDEAAYNPEIFLSPMRDWHLRSEWKDGRQTGARMQMVWLFGSIGIIVLVLACINFINLSTARFSERAKEVGILMSIGSMRTQLIKKFLSESFLTVFFSFLLAIALLVLALSFLNNLVGKNITINWNNPFFWLIATGFMLVTSLMAGFYPAFYLSSFDPVKVLKGTFNVGKSVSVPRKMLVVAQYAVSIILITGTLIIFKQIQFSVNRPVGYERKGLVSVQMKSAGYYEKFDIIRNELLDAGAATDVSASSSPPTFVQGVADGFNWEGKEPGMQAEFAYVFITPEYGKTVGWKIKEGRDMSREFSTDSTTVILNEAAVKFMGVKDPIGMEISWGSQKLHVIGVIDDMVMESPYKPVTQVIYTQGFNHVNWLNFKLNPAKSTGESLAGIESVIKKILPSAPFDYKFIDSEYAAKFSDEKRIASFVAIFAILAIFISCLGLLGLSKYRTEKRTKEIGVRKVNGARISEVLIMLNKEFLIWVTVAFLIATPIAWYAMTKWLESFAYKTTLNWWIFALVGLLVLGIALLTVSWQSWRAATRNPVEALRYE